MKLISAKNSKHQNYPCTKFSRTINALEELAGLLGLVDVTFYTQDDKGKVSTGLTAASKQVPLLMDLEYKVTLPDKDCVIASQHKLIPSVIGDLSVQKKVKDIPLKVLYSLFQPCIMRYTNCETSWPQYLPPSLGYETYTISYVFNDSFNTGTGETKPVMIVTVDGGLREYLRYTKTIECVIDHFTTYDLDAFLLATNVPGRSAFNRIECRMVKFSQ